MADYKTMFLDLYHAVTKATNILMDAQVAAEDIYIDTSPYDAIIDEHEQQRNDEVKNRKRHRSPPTPKR